MMGQSFVVFSLVDCETMEGLDLHSQTREHQKKAMDMVLRIKQQNSTKQKLRRRLCDYGMFGPAFTDKGASEKVENLLPLSQVRENLVETYKKEVEWQRNEMLLPYQKMSSIMKVPVEVVLIESDEVANAISTEINIAKIKVLVVGASSSGLFSRKIKTLSSTISESAPSFCTVYVLSKGKIDSLRPSDSVTNGNILEDSNECTDSSNSSSRHGLLSILLLRIDHPGD